MLLLRTRSMAMSLLLEAAFVGFGAVQPMVRPALSSGTHLCPCLFPFPRPYKTQVLFGPPSSALRRACSWLPACRPTLTTYHTTNF